MSTDLVEPNPQQISAGPRFYLTGRQAVRPWVWLLAGIMAAGGAGGIVYAMGKGHGRSIADSGGGSAAGAAEGNDDDKDDPNQIDTIVLGGPDEAPVPAKKGNHVSPVHPTILIILPRDGKDAGQIPDTEAGRLLYAWLAAFNAGSRLGLEGALPTDATGLVVNGQMELRRETGGFNLVSAKEVERGLLVFRLRDQTPAGAEALGTLAVREDSIPARIGSFSVRVVPASAAQ